MAADRDCDTVVASLFVNPAQFDEDADLAAIRAICARDAELCAPPGRMSSSCRSRDEIYPPAFKRGSRSRSSREGLEGEHRRAISAASPRSASSSSTSSSRAPPTSGRRRAAAGGDPPPRPRPQPRYRDPVGRHRPGRRRPRARRATRASPPRSARPRWRCRGRSRPGTPRPPAPHSPGCRAGRRLRRGGRLRPARPGRRRPWGRPYPSDRQHRPRRQRSGGSMTTRPRTPAPGTPAPGKLALPELQDEGAPAADRHGDRLRRPSGRPPTPPAPT